MGIISQGKALLDALFTRTQRQLLGLFFGHPEHSFYLNQVVRLAGVGTGSVQRELGRMAAAGILTVRQVGNQKHYQANADCPVFDELCAMARKTLGVVEVLRQRLDRLPVRPDLVVLYSDPGDRPRATVRLLVVSDRLDSGHLNSALSGVNLGRKILPWLLDRRRFTDLYRRSDARLAIVMDGAKTVVSGAVDNAVLR